MVPFSTPCRLSMLGRSRQRTKKWERLRRAACCFPAASWLRSRVRCGCAVAPLQALASIWQWSVRSRICRFSSKGNATEGQGMEMKGPSFRAKYWGAPEKSFSRSSSLSVAMVSRRKRRNGQGGIALALRSETFGIRDRWAAAGTVTNRFGGVVFERTRLVESL